MPALRRLLVLLAAVLVVLPAVAVAQDLDTVENRVEDLQGRLADTTARYEDIRARVASTEHELAQLEDRAVELETEIEKTGEMLETRARAAFKHGSDSVFQSLVSADGPQAAAERASLLGALQARDEGQLEHSAALRTQLEQTRELLADKREELATLEEQLATEASSLNDELEAAKTLAADIRQREARKRRIQRGVQSGTYACIFDRGATHFRDTWGAPRSGGRRHKGTDLFAAYGQPVYAFTSGSIQRMNNSGLGGISVYLMGDDGNLYYYTHLSGYAEAAYVGKRVEAGEHIAYNGASGNASRSAPHVHFQMHPGGGAPVNPYQWLAAACF